MKRQIPFSIVLLLFCLILPVRGETDAPLSDGIYSALFKTDSSMFSVNETCEGRGTLTVENGEMTLHVSMTSKNIVNLYPGTAENAAKEGAELLQPTTDAVTYSDGFQDEVYGFDIPVPILDEEFDLALIGKKGKWYDHKVSVSDPQPLFADGEYHCDVTLSGGSGRASVESPSVLTIEGGKITAVIVWSSPYYEYMIVDGERYEPLNSVNSGENAAFVIPVTLDKDMPVSASTTAMSQPHLIDYMLYFDSETIR